MLSFAKVKMLVKTLSLHKCLLLELLAANIKLLQQYKIANKKAISFLRIIYQCR